MASRNIFNDLFVLEMTNNHLGQLERGLKIVRQHSRVVRENNIRAAIKIQFRDVDSFIHNDFKSRTDIRYIRRVTETRMSKSDYAVLVAAIRDSGCIPMATPFDEASVDWCVDFDMPIIKVASADATDWPLLEKIAATKKPVIVSVGGAIEKEIDDVVAFFDGKHIPLAVNHCVAAYPHDADECELNQIDYLRDRYPGIVIGYSSHEHCDWVHSMTMSYAKGAADLERHIDIDADGVQIADYSSLPEEINLWFEAFRTAQKYCGGSRAQRVTPLQRETDFLDNYVRGVYAKRDLPAGHVLTNDDVQLAIPLQKGQISCREFEQGEILLKGSQKGQSIRIDMIESSYADDSRLRETINSRGMDSADAAHVVKHWRMERTSVTSSRLAIDERVKQCG